MIPESVKDSELSLIEFLLVATVLFIVCFFAGFALTRALGY